jgi:RNA polymerase sigma-70 factor (ECF subfamily)
MPALLERAAGARGGGCRPLRETTLPDPCGSVTDEELLRRAADLRDNGAFAELIHRYERELHGYLTRLLRDPHRAEEVVQTTFLRVFEHAHAFQHDRPVRPWIYSIATHLAVDVLRDNTRRHEVSLDRVRGPAQADGAGLAELLAAAVPSPPEELEARELHDWAHRAVDALPEHLRVVVLLVYFQGLKFREAAEALGLPEGTIKSRVHAALVKLAKDWEQGKAPNGTARTKSALERSNSRENRCIRGGAWGAAGRTMKEEMKREVCHATLTDSVGRNSSQDVLSV